MTEIISAIQGQLAFVGAVLGGFAITLLVGLLQIDSPRRILGFAAGAAAAAAMAMLFATVISVLGAIYVADHPDHIAPDGTISPGLARAVQWSARVRGTASLLVSLGSCGWIRSRTLGVLSTLGAVVTAALMLALINWTGIL